MVEGKDLHVSSVVVCVLSLGCGPPDAIPDDRPTAGSDVSATTGIEFVEQTAILLPRDRLLTGAALSPSGDLVVARFARNRGVRLYGESTARDILVNEVDEAIGLEFLSEERLEVVDAASGHVLTTDTKGAVDSRRVLSGSRHATAAARTATGWILAIADSDSTPSRLQLPDEGRIWVPDSSYSRTLGLSGGRGEALVWQDSSPFRVWRIGVGAEWPPVAFEPVSVDWFDDDVASALGQSPTIWSVTSVVAVESGYVQTMANRGTDDRLLLWFNERGRFLRYARIQVPFGFVTAAANAPMILAIRTLNDSELVKYSWEQVSGATVQQKEARP